MTLLILLRNSYSNAITGNEPSSLLTFLLYKLLFFQLFFLLLFYHYLVFELFQNRIGFGSPYATAVPLLPKLYRIDFLHLLAQTRKL